MVTWKLHVYTFTWKDNVKVDTRPNFFSKATWGFNSINTQNVTSLKTIFIFNAQMRNEKDIIYVIIMN